MSAGRWSVAGGIARKARSERGVTLMELLVVMIIASIVSTMVLMTWFALQKSFANTSTADNQRDTARQAMNHMVREIRDAEAQSSNNECAVARARAWWIEIYTTFNENGNTDPSQVPHLVLYRLYQDGTLWRFEDLNGDGVIANIDLNANDPAVPNAGAGPNFSLQEETRGEGHQLISRNITNAVVPYRGSVPANNGTTPLFEYSYIDDYGAYQLDPYVYNTDNRIRIMGVQIELLVDLNPEKAPVYADLLTTVQLRNSRQY
jgi:prepilin-type N-terminal cleavage/methylation domain-containing protein